MKIYVMYLSEVYFIYDFKARVIGRAGSNINAIREATNAHIEVEKMTTRREQATRQITIKGTPDSVQ